MSFRKLTEKERQDTERKIKDTKDAISIRQKYVSELRNRLIEGMWQSDMTAEDYELIQLAAEHDIVWFDQLEQER